MDLTDWQQVFPQSLVSVLAIFAYASGNLRLADYLNIMYIPNLGEVSIFIAAMIGACIGFPVVQYLSGAGIYGRYREPCPGRHHCGTGYHCEKRIIDPDFLRCVPGRKSECDDTGKLF